MKYKVKNLLDAFDDGEVDMMGHQCNCFCKMGSGIAPQIAKRFPIAKQADDKTMDLGAGKLGLWTCGNTLRENSLPGTIINFYGQFFPGETSDDLHVGSLFDGMDRYEPLRHALRAFNLTLCSLDRKMSIGLPKIGAGIAGGDWSAIEQIISDELTNLDVTIYVLNEKELPEWAV